MNGKELMTDGNPSLSTEGYKSGNVPQLGFFPDKNGVIEIIIQVANYEYINSGIPVSLILGEESQLLTIHQRKNLMELGVFFVLLAIDIIYMIFYISSVISKRKDKPLLTFAVLILIFALCNSLLSERPILILFPQLPFELIYKLKDVLLFGGFISLINMFYSLKKGILSLKLTKVLSIIFGCYLFVIVFFSIHIYMKIQIYIIILDTILLVGLFLKTGFIFINSRGMEAFENFLLLTAIASLNIYSLDLNLFSFGYKTEIWYGHLSIIAFSLVMVLLLSLRFFEAYSTIEAMSEDLLKLDKLKDDFLATTSHELKTPLNAIINIAETLIQGVDGELNRSQTEDLSIISRCGRRLSNLVNDLLDYSKMKNGDIKLSLDLVDLKRLTASIIQVYEYIKGNKKLELINSVPEDLPYVKADINRLTQILHNLISNAVKFTESGKVEVTAETENGKIKISISDTGKGINKNMQERIFRSFEQVDSSETRKNEGTGLGLSITKKLVELHGGKIDVLSEPRVGSVFTVLLPSADKSKDIEELKKDSLYIQEKQYYSEYKYPVHYQGTNNESILVVDDDFANLQSIINVLRMDGYSITAVNCGKKALTELDQGYTYSLVVLDVMMPDISGYEVLQKLRSKFSMLELPVLMLTAKDRISDIVLALEKGANDFVEKPFEIEELRARISTLTKLKASVKKAMDSETAFLRSQIKPHFLYNALNSIASLCTDEPEKAEKLTLDLAKFLRNNFKFKNLDTYTTIYNELELIKAYLNIEEARFGKRLTVEYDIEDNINTPIPPLLLQPLVENAVRHGLMSNMKGGTVKISIHKNSGSISFCIADNGCGINYDKITEIFNLETDTGGVGLWNINKRLKLLYGKSIVIESKEGIGTSVSFDIPVI